MGKEKVGNKQEKGERVEQQWRIKEKPCFHKVPDWYWEVKRRRSKNWKIPAVLFIFSSLLHSLPPSLVSLPSLCRVTVSDGTGLTGRQRSKKTVALSSAMEMICDMCIQTHTHSQTFLSGCHWRHQRVDALTQHVAREIRSEHTMTHMHILYVHTHTSTKLKNLASVVQESGILEKCFTFQDFIIKVILGNLCVYVCKCVRVTYKNVGVLICMHASKTC